MSNIKRGDEYAKIEEIGRGASLLAVCLCFRGQLGVEGRVLVRVKTISKTVMAGPTSAC